MPLRREVFQDSVPQSLIQRTFHLNLQKMECEEYFMVRVCVCARAGRFIKGSNKVHQCCNRKGQFSTACLTQCHLVSPESHWKCLSVSSLHLPLSVFHPVFRCLSVSLALCLFSLALASADAASVPSHPFVLDSFASSVSLLVCVYLPRRLCLCRSPSPPAPSLPPSLPRPQPRACRHQRHPQTGRPPWLFRMVT